MKNEGKAMLRSISAAGVIVCLACTAAAAQDAGALPPQNAKKLSEIIAKVEQRQGFRYVKEVDWDKDGYTVTYFTGDSAKVEIKYDAVSGESKAP